MLLSMSKTNWLIIILLIEIIINMILLVSCSQNTTIIRKIVVVLVKCGSDLNLLSSNQTKHLTDKDMALVKLNLHNLTSNIDSSWYLNATYLLENKCDTKNSSYLLSMPLPSRTQLAENTQFGANITTTFRPSSLEFSSISLLGSQTSGRTSISPSTSIKYRPILKTIFSDVIQETDVSSSIRNINENFSSVNSISNEVNTMVTNLEDWIKFKDMYIDFLRLYLEVVNTILGYDKSVIARAQKKYKTSSRILHLLNKLASYIHVQDEENPLSINLSRISFMGTHFNSTSDYFVNGLTITSTKNAPITNDMSISLLLGNASTPSMYSTAGIHFPPSLISKASSMKLNNTTRVIAYAFINDYLFIPSDDLDAHSMSSNRRLNTSSDSIVISASFPGLHIENLTEPMTSYFESINRNVIDSRTRCVYWDTNVADGYGDWSTRGCSMTSFQNNIYSCECDHLTSFAVLLDMYRIGHATPRAEETLTLYIITYIGCGISMAGLIITLYTYLRFKNLRKTLPPRILICLCTSILTLLIVFVIGIGLTSPRIGCQIVGLLLHYFVLTTFCWMAVEGYNLYRCFVKVVGIQNTKFLSKANQFAWGLPALVVGLSASIDWKSYGNDKNCMLHGVMFYFAILTPVFAVLTMNFVLLFLVLIGIRKGSKLTKDKKRQGASQLRIAFACSIILGLTWASAIFAVGDLRFTFQIIFCLLNSFQGFFIFIFYCARNPDVRKEWRRALGMNTSPPGTEYSNRNQSGNNRNTTSGNQDDRRTSSNSQ